MELVKIENNKDHGLVVSSRVIAERLGKQHKHVIRDLENLISPNLDRLESLIFPSQYKDSRNRNYKEYLLTKDGFTLYMFNIQGYIDFKMAYINRFNEMERELKDPKRKAMEEPREIVPKFYRGTKVMTFDDLAVLSGRSKEAAYWQVKNILPNYTILRDEELALFKRTNGVYPMAKSLAVLYRDEAISFCEYIGIDPSRVHAYFQEEEPKKTQNPDLYRAELLTRVIPYLNKMYGGYIAGHVVRMVMGDKIVKEFEFAMSRMKFKEYLMKMGAKEFSKLKKISLDSPEYRALSPRVKEYMDKIFSEVEQEIV
ncbi:MAG: Rha family transcriptional regulator [Peptostreptococcaceae bacterium]|nr:Rha family transcriptional regulator [Peptostreptococcaceae bacterium]